jgi:hypothetical protein
MIVNSIFLLDISYSQVCVFWETLRDPFNEWEQIHFDQAFAWRVGSACFRTIEEAGPHEIFVVVAESDEPVSASAVRVIEVPFDVASAAGLEVASISDSAKIHIPSALYSLRFELFEKDSRGIVPVRLIFIRNATPGFQIRRADPDLNPPPILLKTAQPSC